ncbi:fructose-amino acid ABC transporter (ATP-binding subunit) [Kyrpidia spormannii]|uniref:Fructose-amino acid ABC transporter (ATP-binding subunit) n=1 Tax=Kyrpidia spormannii TaxID=2055160 RepID=A0ACA8ZBU4_9BACL|nr:fructose-amino acid ABC transporter (ATP-binding subunit) [Kyrpidia spormannii]
MDNDVSPVARYAHPDAKIDGKGREGVAGVTFKNVIKSFGQHVLVHELNLEIPDGEFMVLVGPSGCGKSTTLRMVAGLEEVSSGELYIGDRLVNDVPPKDRDIAMVFQNYALYPHMTVFDNMAFGLKLRKVPKAEIDQRVREAAKTLGIDHLLDRKPKALSGGQRQRVALGRAIVRDPQVFLMDEPLSNLDAKLRVQMRAEISRLRRRLETTTIYVTHDQTEAMTMGDRIAVMKDGVVQQVDSPEKIYHSPANLFVAGFIGSPAMNMVSGRWGEEDGHVVFTAGDIRIALPGPLADAVKRKGVGPRVVLGVRPEHLHPATSENDAGFEVNVEVVEPTGAETYLYVSHGDQALTVRVDPSLKAEPGQRLKVAPDLSKIHLFDEETEEAVR